MDFLFRIGLVLLAGFFLFDYVPSIYEYVTGRKPVSLLAHNRDDLAFKCANASTPVAQDMWCGLLDQAVMKEADQLAPAAGPAQSYPPRHLDYAQPLPQHRNHAPEPSPRQRYSLTRHRHYD